MASFWSEIESNKRNSVILMAVFIVFASFCGLVFGYAIGGDETWSFLGLFFAVGISVIFALVSFYSGDSLVMAMAGAKQARKAEHPHLVNLVEGLAIAAGIPAPKIYVINDASPNAFATGRDPQHAAIAVTTGLLEVMNRSELEGVVAHEMGHIKNFDTRYAVMAVVLVGVVVILSDVFLRMVFRGGFGGGNNRKGGSAYLVLVALAIVLAVLAPIFAQLLKLALSRQREYLADATSAQLTRHPEGLASALEKINSSKTAPKFANDANSHLFIANPLKGKFLAGLFSTHPPIQERIRRLRTM